MAISPHSARAPFSDGQSVIISAHEYFLSDIVAPSPAQPLADYARAVFEEATRRGPLPAPEAEQRDRWDRISGVPRYRTATGRETSLQEILVGAGAARVAPQTDDFPALARLFILEDRARAARLGIWSHHFYRARDAGRAEWSAGFAIYQGAIVSAAERRDRVYLNFGDDYKTDFTATVARSRFRRWRSPIDPAVLAGQVAEVRGVVEFINGPSIELNHELQLRLLS